MLGKLRKAGAFSWSDWFVLVEVSALLPLVRIGVRVISFKTLASLLAGNKPLRETGTPNPDRTAYLVNLASRHHFLKPTCLEKAIILYAILRREGISAEITIGTMKKNGEFQAHAWVEYLGRVILGRSVEPYAPLFSLDEARSQRKFA